MRHTPACRCPTVGLPSFALYPCRHLTLLRSMSFIDLLRHLRHRTWSRWPIMALLVLAFGGCGGLPKDVNRPVSTALDTAGEPTELATMVQQLRQKAGARHASGFSLLSGPQEAYGSRLALVQSAQKTLDLQYYAIHADASSAHLLRSVVNAARRGVRVRILLDDFHSTGRNALVMRMAFEPNIEMRMFNPVAGPRASFLGRMWGAVSDFSRVQQRMHNKLLLSTHLADVSSRFGRPRECNLVHSRMCDQVLPDRSAAVDDVGDTVGKAGLHRSLGEDVCIERGFRGRFEDNRAPGGQCRRDLEHRQRGGKIPRSDRSDDAEGRTSDPGATREGLTVSNLLGGQELDKIGVVPQQLHRRSAFGESRQLDRHTVLGGHHRSSGVGASLQRLGEPSHRSHADRAVSSAVRVERSPRGSHRCVNVIRTRFWNGPELLFGERRDHRDRGVGRWGQPPTAHEQFMAVCVGVDHDQICAFRS